MRLRDLVGEAVAGLTQRPSRSVFTAMGTVLGLGAFVAVLGLTSTANGQITKQFNELTATQIAVRQATGEGVPGGLQFPADADARVRAIGGVKSSGVLWYPDSLAISVLPPGLDQTTTLDESQVPVIAVSSGMWDLLNPVIEKGRVFDNYLATQPVAVIGEGLATELGLTDLGGHQVVFISGHAFTVIGIISTTHRLEEPQSAISIPSQVALEYWGPPSRPGEMTVETNLGAADVVADQAPLALDAFHPEHFVSATAAVPSVLRNNVSGELRTLFLALAGVCLFVGAVGIANANLVAVLERTAEIGLRRSVGAQPRHVGFQFLVESTILGSFGGVLGASVGVLSVIAVSLARQWTPVIEPRTVVAAPLLGAVIGLLAGFYPSIRASRIEPVEAFRR